MKRVSPNTLISAPVFHRGEPPVGITRTMEEWLRLAGIPCKVSGRITEREVRLVDGLPDHAWYAQGNIALPEKGALVARTALPYSEDDEELAMRVVEVMAFGFHDYVARESVCGRGIFSNFHS